MAEEFFSNIKVSGDTEVSGKFIKKDGLSTQFLKADGSVDSSSYLTSLPNHNHTFASLAAKPTTISGYGITDTFAPVNAEQNVQSDWNATSGDEFIKNKPSSFNSNITVRRALIPVSALPANFTSTDVKNWLNANQSIGDNEVLFWETTGEVVTVTLAINILTPTEGQSITGDLNTSFKILGATSINITSPIEGESITGDLITSFEIII